jgi:hypothetical protein
MQTIDCTGTPHAKSRALEVAMSGDLKLFLLDSLITGGVTAVIIAYAIFLARIEARELKPKEETMRREALRHAS